MTDTTFRHHSLFIQADQKVFAAEQKRAAAHRAAEDNPNGANMKRFLEADAAFKEAVKERDQVRGMKKFMHGTVGDTQ